MANPKVLAKPALAPKGAAKSLKVAKPKPKSAARAGQAASPAGKGILSVMSNLTDYDALVQKQGGRIFDTTQLYRFDPQTRIAVIRRGVPAAVVGELSTTMGTSKEFLLGSLGMSRATIGRKEKGNAVLSSDESERILGVAALIGKVQAMVEESGDPAGFDAAHWVAEWLAKPLPALGGATPGSYMDTFEGQKLISELLAMSQSGAYA